MEETIGQQLSQARETRKFTLEQVAQATRIRVHYLRAMEQDDFGSLPSKAQARGFLRAYAGYLNLDPEPLLEKLEDGRPAPTPPRAASPSPASSQAAPSVQVDYQQSDAIFADVGQRLRQQRELLGLSLDDVARHTRLRLHYLQALEAGDILGLTSLVQGRGMLENYAVFLGLDPEPLLLRYAEGIQTRHVLRRSVAAPSRTDLKTQPIQRPSRRSPQRSMPAPLRRLFSPDILIGVTFAIFLAIFVLWGSIRIFAMRSSEPPTQTAPSIAEVLLATATASPPATAVTETPSQPGAQPVIVGESDATGAPQITGFPGGVEIYLTVLQRAFMRVLVDGEVQFEGRVIPGNAYPFAGESQIEIMTSNGAALNVFYGQQDLGPMGLYGQVVYRIYTAKGVLTPTATITLTPTQTRRVTPSATVRPPVATPTVPVLP
jgi:cytoskeletal protein RodZ